MNEPLNPITPLTQERVEQLCTSIVGVLRENYLRGPESQERAFEALNALAACAAMVIIDCDGPWGEAHQFFNKVLLKNIRAFYERTC